jgi:hypothetical protein
MFFKTEDLISSSKRSEFFPTGQTTFVDPDDLIAFANEEMATKLVPAIMTIRQDFFLESKQVSIQASLQTYSVPERAIGNAFKDLLYQASATDSSYRYPLAKTNPHDVGLWNQSDSNPGAYFLQGDQVYLVNKPPQSVGALVFFYYARPNKLISTSSAAKITAVSSASGTTTLTVDTDLTGSLTTGALIDFLSSKSPFRLWAEDVAITSISTTQIQVATSALQDGAGNVTPVVGDYICPAQSANIPMIPSEFHPILAEMICYRALKALGHTTQMQVCQAHINEMLQGAFKLIAQRVEQEVDVVFERNGILGAVGMSGLGWNG